MSRPQPLLSRLLMLLAAASPLVASAQAEPVEYRFLESGLVGKMFVVDQAADAAVKKPIAVAIWSANAADGSGCALNAVEDVSRRNADGAATTATLWVLDAQKKPTSELIEIRFSGRSAHISSRAGGDWCRNDATFSGRWARTKPR